MRFFDARWKGLGTRHSLAETISDITGIKESLLQEPEYTLRGDLLRIHDVPISERMSWVPNRVTTRLEDIAYCMLGIFNISMPLLYGEGPKAFAQLQEELVKISDDHALFVWDFVHCPDEQPGPRSRPTKMPATGRLTYPSRRLAYLEHMAPAWSSQSRSSMIAAGPVCFYDSAGFQPFRRQHWDGDQPIKMPTATVNLGLSIRLRLLPIGPLGDGTVAYESNRKPIAKQRANTLAILDARNQEGEHGCFLLKKTSGAVKSYARLPSSASLLLIRPGDADSTGDSEGRGLF